MNCQDCGKPADELIVNFTNLNEYRWTCPDHRNKWLYKVGWYRAGEQVKQVVLMNQAKDVIVDTYPTMHGDLLTEDDIPRKG